MLLVLIGACMPSERIVGARPGLTVSAASGIPAPTGVRRLAIAADFDEDDYLCGGYGGGGAPGSTDCEGLSTSSTGMDPVVMTFSRPVSVFSVTAADVEAYSYGCVDDRGLPATCHGVSYRAATGRAVAYDSAGAVVAEGEFIGHETYAQLDLSAAAGIARVVIDPTSPYFQLGSHSYAIYAAPGTKPPVLHLTCSMPTRGTPVRCEARLSGNVPYTVVERRAKGRGFTIVERPGAAVSAGATSVWEGTAVARSEVKFKVRYAWDGKERTASAATVFDVGRRDWPEMQLTAAPTHRREAFPPILLDYPSNGTLGFFWFESPSPSATPVGQPQSGPNTGLWYLTQPVAMPQDIYAYTHPGLYANATGGRQWRADQNGQGGGTCQESVLAMLAVMAEVHEGVARAGDSHYGKANVALRAEDVAGQFEALYSGRNEAELLKQAERVYGRFRDGPLKQTQAAFDATDRPLIFGALGCKLDFIQQDS